MKLSVIAFGACAIVLLGSCSKKSEKPVEEQAAPVETEVSQSAVVVASSLADLFAQDTTIQVTPSGLGYKIVKQTKGVTPERSSVVQVKYTGKHLDGSVFDTSGDNAVTFPLNQVVPGFSEGIALMPVGSTYVLYLPAELAYGSTGVPQAGIEPDEPLVFEVELIEIEQM